MSAHSQSVPFCADWAKIARCDEDFLRPCPPRVTEEEARAGRWQRARRVVLAATIRSLPGSGRTRERLFAVLNEGHEEDGEERTLTLMSDNDHTEWIFASDIGRTYERVPVKYVEIWCTHEAPHGEVVP